MGHKVNSHDYADLYQILGIDLSALGCVMLGIRPLPVREALGEELSEALYTSPDPKKFWIKGPVAQEGGHVTLLYGILKSMWPFVGYEEDYFQHIDRILADWRQPITVQFEDVLAWPDPAGGPSTTLVASVHVDPLLLEAHQRLSLLPHVDTFLDYHPHVTLAYVRNEAATAAYDALRERFAGYEVRTTDLDYGHPA